MVGAESSFLVVTGSFLPGLSVTLLRVAEAYDVHIGYPPPARWDKVADGSVRLYKMLGGTEVRPTITSEKFDWSTLGVTPRWVGEDTSGELYLADYKTGAIYKIQVTN